MQKRGGFVLLGAALLLVAVGLLSRKAGHAGEGKGWRVEADYIEACSCHLFCPCYFYPAPEGGHQCEFNNAVKVAKGSVGGVNVDGCKFWMSGDLGGDFSKGEMKSVVITFDPSVTKEQREALRFLIQQIYPVKWGHEAVDEAPITWEMSGIDAHAKLGEAGEITLKGVKDRRGNQTIVTNLNYWGAQKNDGFHLAKGTHRYKGHDHDYSYENMNGFTIHIESEGAEGEKR
jgi:hypothetical protein